jgi:hypothetical protein
MLTRQREYMVVLLCSGVQLRGFVSLISLLMPIALLLPYIACFCLTIWPHDPKQNPLLKYSISASK